MSFKELIIKNKSLGNKTVLFWHLQKLNMCFFIKFKLKWWLNCVEVLIKSTLEQYRRIWPQGWSRLQRRCVARRRKKKIACRSQTFNCVSHNSNRCSFGVVSFSSYLRGQTKDRRRLYETTNFLLKLSKTVYNTIPDIFLFNIC